MRRLAILAFAGLLALGALAFVPPTAAIPPVCIERYVEQGPLTAHVGQCDPQWVLVDLCPAWGSPTRHVTTNSTGLGLERLSWVDIHWCTPHTPPPTAAPANTPGPCGVGPQRCPAPYFPDVRDLLPTDIPYCITAECGPVAPAVGCSEKEYVVQADTRHNLTTHEDCTAHLETNKGVICVGAWTATDERDIGPIHWTNHRCEFPGGDPLGGVSFTSAQPQPCTCPPPQPLCDPITSMVADNEDELDWRLTDTCRLSIDVDVAECGLQGEETTTRTVGVLTVGYHHCAQPSQQMADPFPTCVTEPCGPSAPQAPTYCELEEATPTSVGPLGIDLRTLLWGPDSSVPPQDPRDQCDVDVEPIGACAPPSGRMVEKRVAFVHLQLLLCGGDLPDWS